MLSKNLIIPVFVLISLLQLVIPARMILNKEDILASGTAFSFRMVPVDPNDPFRGKYITLRFSDNTFDVAGDLKYYENDRVYVLFTTDADGFAQIKSVSKIKPDQERDYLKTTVAAVLPGKKTRLTLEYPFTRFYMQEFKAPEAERLVNEAMQDTSAVSYAVVNIKDGQSVLVDVMLNGISISEQLDKTSQVDK